MSRKKWHSKKKPKWRADRKCAKINEYSTVADIQEKHGILPDVLNQMKSATFKLEYSYRDPINNPLLLERTFKTQLLINLGYIDLDELDSHEDDS